MVPRLLLGKVPHTAKLCRDYCVEFDLGVAEHEEAETEV